MSKLGPKWRLARELYYPTTPRDLRQNDPLLTAIRIAVHAA
jgi:hypothetical protein